MQQRKALLVSGQVQGVGFRPFVWRLANKLKLTGSIRNTAQGVEIEVQGSQTSLDSFMRDLEGKRPPLARISSIKSSQIGLKPGETEFVIQHSQSASAQNVLISPDISICDDCLADIRSAGNPRHAYAFTNCVNCGPRYTITKSIPYDRPATVMDCFPLCPACKKEYDNPGDRRFHAQPIACPTCGPKLWYVDEAARQAGRTLPTSPGLEDPIGQAGRALMQGKLVALKGLGGFQLACDARNPEALARLRARKQRPHKALAVMAQNLESVREFCAPGASACDLLTGARKPVVVCPLMQGAIAPLPDLVAPDCDSIGVMLPYTPLHALLFDWLARAGMKNPVLVMTSANKAANPICLGNREALDKLAGIADGWLLHNRDILVRVDDSVVIADELPAVTGLSAPPSPPPIVVRRARGFTPEPVDLGLEEMALPVFGAGAELKSSFCLTRNGAAFLSQHIGDLKNEEAYDFYREAYGHMQRLLGSTPRLVVRDLHPDYLSSQFAQELARAQGVPIVSLQHHAAHAATALAEHQVDSAALALCLDGSGLGADGTIWGGELLLLDPAQPRWQRVGGLKSFPLPGAEQAILEPWRTACALAWRAGLTLPYGNKSETAKLQKMLEKNFNTPLTSSAGRLFDGVAAMLGLCASISYEGQAAIRLEKAAKEWLRDNPGTTEAEFPGAPPDFPLISGAWLNSEALYSAVWTTFLKTRKPGKAAALFHIWLAGGLVELCSSSSKTWGTRLVALSGGCMQNSLLLGLLESGLRNAGLTPLMHERTPPGDGGLALGQAWWGHLLLRSQGTEAVAR